MGFSGPYTGESGRRGVSEFLSKKGYKFSEELDLGQLDKQFRQPLVLAETKAPPQRKRKKKLESRDIFSFGEDDDNGEDAAGRDGDLSVRIHKTEAERELEVEREEARKREALEWGTKFNVYRSDLTKQDNAVLRETFVTDTKSIYQEVDALARKHRAALDSLGVFDDSINTLRAESQKRVLLSKRLRLEELKRRSEQQVEARSLLARTGQADALEAALHAIRAGEEVRRKPLGGAGGVTCAAPAASTAASRRQRQRAAEDKDRRDRKSVV